MFIVACGPISALLRANTYLTLKPLVSNVYSSFSSPQNPRENVARWAAECFITITSWMLTSSVVRQNADERGETESKVVDVKTKKVS